MAYYVTEPPYVISAAVFLTVLDVFFVTCRFWARKRQKAALKADDWLLIPAVIMITGLSVATTYGVVKGSLAHPTIIPADFEGNPLDLSTSQISLGYKIQWSYDLALPLTQGCIKSSFLFFYLRIFSVNKRSFNNYLLWTLITIVGLAAISFFFAGLFQCRVSFWALWGTTSGIVDNCVETMQLVLSVCITGVILDVIIFVVPIPLVWRLNTSRTKKLSIVAVFLLGSVSIVASLLRLVNLAILVTEGFSADADGLLVVTQYLYWGLVESGVAVIAACLPTLQILIGHNSWKLNSQSLRGLFSFSWTSRRSQASSGQGNIPSLTESQVDLARIRQHELGIGKAGMESTELAGVDGRSTESSKMYAV